MNTFKTNFCKAHWSKDYKALTSIVGYIVSFTRGIHGQLKNQQSLKMFVEILDVVYALMKEPNSGSMIPLQENILNLLDGNVRLIGIQTKDLIIEVAKAQID